MATLGSFAVEIMANTARLTGDMGKAVKIVEQQAARLNAIAAKSGAIIGAGFAAGVSGAAALTLKSINLADQFDEMSQKVGVAAAQLSTLSYAAKRGGLDLATFEGGMVKLTKAASDTARGTGEARAGFEALGVSVKNTDGTLKGADQLLTELASEFAELEDGANKTALAVSIFGRSGAQMLPFLAQGAEGIAEVQQRARDLGLEIDNTTAALAGEFNDSLDDMRSLVTGFGNDIAKVMLPSLVALSSEAVENGIQMRKAGGAATVFAEGLKGVLAAAYMVKGGIESITNVIAAQVDVVGAANDVFRSLDPAQRALALLRGEVLDTGSALQNFRSTFTAAASAAGDGIEESQAKVRKALDALYNPLTQMQAAQDAAVDGTLDLVDELGRLERGALRTAPALAGIEAAERSVGRAQEESRRIAEELRQEQDAYRNSILDLEAQLAGPLAVAQREYAKNMADLQDKLDRGVVTVDEATRAQAAYGEQLKRTKQEIEAQRSPAQLMLEDIQFETELLRMNNAEREVAIALRQLSGKATEEETAKIHAALGALERQREAAAAAAEFERIWLDATNNVGDALTTALFEGAESGADAIKDVMEQLARDLVRFWLQQEIVIPLQQRLMGGMEGGGFGSLLGGGQWGMFGSQAGWNAAAAGGPPANLSGTFGSSLFGSSAGRLWGGNTGMAAAGNVLGAAAGIYGVYDNYRNGPGGLRGGLSGAASGAMAGTAIMPGIGTVIGAVIGGLAGLFGGRDERPRIRINSSGAGIGNIGTRGQTALGSLAFNADDLADTRGTEAQLLQAIQQLDQGISDIVSSISGGADQLDEIRTALASWSIDLRNGAISAENVLGSRFNAILNTFDADVQQFVRGAGDLQAQIAALAEYISRPDRLAGMLGELGRNDMLAGMSEIERQTFLLNEQFDAVAAQAAALGATQEQLAQIEQYRANALGRLTQAEQDAAESLELNIEAMRAYATSVQDLQAQLDDLNATSDFQREIMAIGRAYRQNVDALNAAARAAGLHEARIEDLALAHQLAARQAAQAIAQLTQAGRQLGSELYGSALGDIESQIAAVEAQANGTQQALGSFASAVQEVAAAASDAVNLLLGDLSPLKDRQKLDIALQALRRGEIGAEQVLQIGRRLFASGSDYNQLFEQVLAIQNARPAGMGDAGGAGGGAAAPNVANPALQALYDERDRLLREQDQMDRRVRAFDLAQMVADVAGATGESFADVLATFTNGRATVDQFAQDLGIDVAELEDFLETLQAATYSPFDYAESLRVEFDRFLDGLRAILQPPPSTTGASAPGEVALVGGKPVGPGGVLPGFEIADPADPMDSPVLTRPVEVEPIGERPIEREFIDEMKVLRQDFNAMIGLVAQHTGMTAEGIGELVQQRRFDSLTETAAKPRSSRGVTA